MAKYYKQKTNLNTNYFLVESNMVRIVGLSENLDDLQIAYADSKYFNIDTVKDPEEITQVEWNAALNIFIERVKTYKTDQ